MKNGQSNINNGAAVACIIFLETWTGAKKRKEIKKGATMTNWNQHEDQVDYRQITRSGCSSVAREVFHLQKKTPKRPHQGQSFSDNYAQLAKYVQVAAVTVHEAKRYLSERDEK